MAMFAWALSAWAPARAATITVTTTSEDPSAGCTLAEAIASAETDSSVGGCSSGAAGSDTISLPVSGAFTLSTATDSTEGASAFSIATGIRIEGHGATLTLTGTGPASSLRAFRVAAAGDLTLVDLDIMGGRSIGGAIPGQGQAGNARGGTIHNSGVLNLSNVSITDSVARGATGEDAFGAGQSGGVGEGGAIYNSGTTNIAEASIDASEAHGGDGGSELVCNAPGYGGHGGAGRGGAIFNLGSLTVTGPLTITNPAVSGGQGGFGCSQDGTNGSPHGGGIYNGVTGSTALDRVTITGSDAGGVSAGGALYSAGPATVARSTFSSNEAVLGAALYQSGNVLAITGSTLSDNSAHAGGGVYVAAGSLAIGTSSILDNQAVTGSYGGALVLAGGSVTVDRSLVMGNNIPGASGGSLTPSEGGAFAIRNGSAVVSRTAFVGNAVVGPELQATGAYGGAVWVGADSPSVTVTNSTFSLNSTTGAPGRGAAVYVANGTVVVAHSTISENTSEGAVAEDGPGTLSLRNSILSENVGANCFGPTFNEGENLQYPGTTCGAIPEADPLLGTLENVGGTRIYRLDPSSPAVNAASDAYCPTTDQRGVARPQLGACDLGAHEYKEQRPDGLISKRRRSGYIGNNIYNATGRKQTIKSNQRRGTARTYFVKIQNDGAESSSFRIKGSRNPSGATVAFLLGTSGPNITSAMRSASGYKIVLAPKAGKLIRMRVVIKTRASLGSIKKVGVTTVTPRGSLKDVVRAVLSTVR